MVGIQGIGGVSEPKPDRPTNTRDRTDAVSAGGPDAKDGVVLSSQAQAAAKVLKATQAQTEIRTERVEAAKAALERGDFKKPEIVAKVAERIENLL